MQISMETKMLVMRYADFHEYDFIAEHKNIIVSNGNVWLLKIGKIIPQTKIDELYQEGGVLLLKGPKASGGKYYALQVVDIHTGTPNKNMVYPKYYEKIVLDENMWAVESLFGNWFKVSNIIEVPSDMIGHIFLASNRKNVEDVLSSTRSSMVYVVSDKELML